MIIIITITITVIFIITAVTVIITVTIVRSRAEQHSTPGCRVSPVIGSTTNLMHYFKSLCLYYPSDNTPECLAS